MFVSDGLSRLGVNDKLVVNVLPSVINKSFNDFRWRANGNAE